MWPWTPKQWHHHWGYTGFARGHHQSVEAQRSSKPHLVHKSLRPQGLEHTVDLVWPWWSGRLRLHCQASQHVFHESLGRTCLQVGAHQRHTQPDHWFPIWAVHIFQWVLFSGWILDLAAPQSCHFGGKLQRFFKKILQIQCYLTAENQIQAQYLSCFLTHCSS